MIKSNYDTYQNEVYDRYHNGAVYENKEAQKIKTERSISNKKRKEGLC